MDALNIGDSFMIVTERHVYTVEVKLIKTRITGDVSCCCHKDVAKDAEKDAKKDAEKATEAEKAAETLKATFAEWLAEKNKVKRAEWEQSWDQDWDVADEGVDQTVPVVCIETLDVVERHVHK